jgi:CRP-like cAMP-binding protein
LLLESRFVCHVTRTPHATGTCVIHLAFKNRASRRLEEASCNVTPVNRVLRAASIEAQRRIQPYLERVRLAAGKVLYEPGETMRHAWCPEHGVLSLLALTADGAATEVGMVGAEGVIGLPILLPINTAPYQVLVQIPGEGYRLRADVFRGEFHRDTSVQEAVLEHVHALFEQMAQSNVCNRYHNVQQRLSRWLLMTHDRVGVDVIPLTQEFLGHMLGANRKRVSYAAAQLQDAACIRQRHGQIRILDRRRLEQRACECYALVRQHEVRPPPATTRTVAGQTVTHRIR